TTDKNPSAIRASSSTRKIHIWMRAIYRSGYGPLLCVSRIPVVRVSPRPAGSAAAVRIGAVGDQQLERLGGGLRLQGPHLDRHRAGPDRVAVRSDHQAGQELLSVRGAQPGGLQ